MAYARNAGVPFSMDADNVTIARDIYDAGLWFPFGKKYSLALDYVAGDFVSSWDDFDRFLDLMLRAREVAKRVRRNSADA